MLCWLNFQHLIQQNIRNFYKQKKIRRSAQHSKHKLQSLTISNSKSFVFKAILKIVASKGQVLMNKKAKMVLFTLRSGKTIKHPLVVHYIFRTYRFLYYYFNNNYIDDLFSEMDWCILFFRVLLSLIIDICFKVSSLLLYIAFPFLKGLDLVETSNC